MDAWMHGCMGGCMDFSSSVFVCLSVYVGLCVSLCLCTGLPP